MGAPTTRGFRTLGAVLALACACQLGPPAEVPVREESASTPVERTQDAQEERAEPHAPEPVAAVPQSDYGDLLAPADGPTHLAEKVRALDEPYCADDRPITEVAGPWTIDGREWFASVCLPDAEKIDNEGGSGLYVEVQIHELKDGDLVTHQSFREAAGGGPVYSFPPHLMDNPVVRPNGEPCALLRRRWAEPGDFHETLTVLCDDENDPLDLRLPQPLPDDCQPLRQTIGAEQTLVTQVPCASSDGEPEHYLLRPDGSFDSN